MMTTIKAYDLRQQLYIMDGTLKMGETKNKMNLKKLWTAMR